MSVYTERMGTVHFIAQCKDCDWEDAMGGDRTKEQVRSSAWRHADQNGHVVTCENATATTYTGSVRHSAWERMKS